MALDVRVDISAEDIEAQVVQAIAATALGSKLKQAIEKALESLGSQYSYDNQLRKWVEEKMRDIVYQHVKDNYSTQIEEKIKTWLTSAKLTEVTNSVISVVVSELTTKNRY